MAAITWKNVNAPSASGIAALGKIGTEGVTNAFSNLADRFNNRDTRLNKEATNNDIARAMAMGDLEQMRANRGSFQGSLNSRSDAAAVMEAFNNQLGNLREGKSFDTEQAAAERQIPLDAAALEEAQLANKHAPGLYQNTLNLGQSTIAGQKADSVYKGILGTGRAQDTRLTGEEAERARLEREGMKKLRDALNAGEFTTTPERKEYVTAAEPDKVFDPSEAVFGYPNVPIEDINRITDAYKKGTGITQREEQTKAALIQADKNKQKQKDRDAKSADSKYRVNKIYDAAKLRANKKSKANTFLKTFETPEFQEHFSGDPTGVEAQNALALASYLDNPDRNGVLNIDSIPYQFLPIDFRLAGMEMANWNWGDPNFDKKDETEKELVKAYNLRTGR